MRREKEQTTYLDLRVLATYHLSWFFAMFRLIIDVLYIPFPHKPSRFFSSRTPDGIADPEEVVFQVSPHGVSHPKTSLASSTLTVPNPRSLSPQHWVAVLV